MAFEVMVDAGTLREQVKEKYREVAVNPRGGFHFHTGRPLAARLGDDEHLTASFPDSAVESFAGVADPLSLRPPLGGERVVDLGSGGGFECFVAAMQVGPKGHVVGVDMTQEMLLKARGIAAEMGLNHVEFREGLIEDLPVGDGWAEVVISNGVINLCADKRRIFSEIHRVLRSGGGIQFADIAPGNPRSPKGRGLNPPVGVRVPPAAPSQYSKGIWPRAKFPFFAKTARLAQIWLAGLFQSTFVRGNGGSRSENASGSLPQGPSSNEGIYFFFPGVFIFSVLTLRFAVFPGGTHPQPQFIFLAIMSPPFVRSLFCRLRSSASTDAPPREVPREANLLHRLFRHPDDLLLELLLSVVKPFPDGTLLDAEEARRLRRGNPIEVAEQNGEPEHLGQGGDNPPDFRLECIGLLAFVFRFHFGLLGRRRQVSRVFQRCKTVLLFPPSEGRVPGDGPKPRRERFF